MAGSSSLVQELQRLATDKSNDITDLLRKALLVATKLKATDFREWIENELHGYGNRKVPDYRTARAQLKAVNPYHGYIPFIIKDQQLSDEVSQVEIRDGISTLVGLLDEGQGREGPLIVPFTDQQKIWLTQGQDFFLEPVRILGHHRIEAVLDTVRTMILDWALKLEGEGIVGQGLSFSDEEKRKAASSPQIRIENFQGILGDVANSTVSQNLKMTVKRGDFGSVREYFRSQGVEDTDIDELEQAIESDPTPIETGRFGPRVSDWIGKMVGKAASNAWQIGVGAAAGLLAQAISSYYGV